MRSIGDLQVIGVTPVGSNALANSFQAFNKGSGCVYGFNILSFDTATAYLILLFDSLTLPVNGAVTPLDFFFVPAASGASAPAELSIAYTPYAISFLNGLWLAGSTALTTPYTLTVATNTKLAFSVKGNV